MLFNYFSKIDLFPPEFLHSLFLNYLKFIKPNYKKKFSNLEFNLLHKSFLNPLGLAAGFDKNAEAMEGEFNLGFGFLELGTVTPMPQIGNKKPRVFKIPEYEAVIQRLGFNNNGVERFLVNLNKYRIANQSNLVGANIGKNKNSPDNHTDYKLLIDCLDSSVDYITINISSPNTEGLRQLERKGNFEKFLEEIIKVNKKNIPLFIKVSPDIDENDLKNICQISLVESQVKGLIISNTTIKRNRLTQKPIKNAWKIMESGGLSGPPLKYLSNEVISKAFKFTKGKLVLVGVGGVSSGQDVYDKILLGCNLVQIYTALIYHGPSIVGKILSELSSIIAKNGYKNVKDVVGKGV